MSENYETLVEWRDTNGTVHGDVLDDGESFDFRGTDNTVLKVEVRESEKPDLLAADGGAAVRHSMTVAEAAQPDDTVEDRLRAAYHCHPLLQVVTGKLDASTLTLEDWTRPLKLTGGKVCLRLTYPGFGTYGWVRRRHDGLLIYRRTSHTLEGPSAVTLLRDDIGLDRVIVEPVIIEETPFGGDES